MKPPSAWRAAYWVLRRDLHVLLRAPLLYVIGGLFLVVHGVTFAALVRALSDPTRPSPLTALLEAQLSGTLLTWVLELVVLALLGMRAIADDKKSGAWELLLTAQVGEGAAVVGKWLAAAVVYALLWLPTLLHLVVLAVFRTDGGEWDAASIAAGYLGAIALGAALLAWPIAASAAMSSVLGAGALAFALLLGLFLVGELPAIAPDLAADHPSLHAALDAVSLRSTVAAFARGELALTPIVFVLGVAITGLSAAITFAGSGRRRDVGRRGVATLLVALCAAVVLVLAVRHPMRVDVSASKRSTLDGATTDVLARVDTATITIVTPTLAAMEPLSAEVARIAGLLREAAPGITVRMIDPLVDQSAVETVARDAGMTRDDLALAGAVIVEANGRRRVVDVLALVAFDPQKDTSSQMFDQVTVEQALAGALAQVTQTTPVGVCMTTGHGELPLAAAPDQADWSRIAERLRADGMTVETLSLAEAVPARCTVVVVAGPITPLAANEALVLQAHLGAGGALVVAAASRGQNSTLTTTGLEALLGNAGLGLPLAIVFDEQLVSKRAVEAMRVTSGYSAHPINRGFQNIRGTAWFFPRPVLTERGAQPLVSTTPDAWGETNLVTGPAVTRDDSDLAGPLAVAAIGSGERILALGSAEALSTEMLTKVVSASDHWFVGAVRYLARVPQPSLPPASTYVPVRLELTDGQRTLLSALTIGGIPLAWLVIGGLVVFLRGRKSRT